MSKPLCLIFAVLIGSAAYADQFLHSDFAKWATAEDMLPATLAAVDSNGNLITTYGVGGKADEPLAIASISKTIAAQCVLELMTRGTLELKMTLSDTLGWHGPKGEVTIADLLTNSSGLGGKTVTQSLSATDLSGNLSLDTLLDRIEARPYTGSTDEPNYDNDNWVLLEAIVASFVEGDILDWCKENVPALLAFQSLKRYQPLGSVTFGGGMSASAQDLARFFSQLEYKTAWPQIELSEGNYYGPGVFITHQDSVPTLYHTGAFCRTDATNIGAMAARLSNGVGVVFIYTGCAERSDIKTLNRLIETHFEDMP